MSGVYLSTSCDCSNNINVACSNLACPNTDMCSNNGCNVPNAKRIYHASMVPSSVYRLTLSSSTVASGPGGRQKTFNVNYNQSSDRNQKHSVPFSTPRFRMKNAPGVSSAGNGITGGGVDIKHNSYDRYLARKKGFAINHKNQPIWHKSNNVPSGTTNETFNIINGCRNNCS